MALFKEKTKVFDINDYLQKHSKVDESHIQKDEEVEENLTSFYELVEKVSEDFNKKYDDSKLTDEELMKRQELEHKAIIGDLQAEHLLVSEIESYLRERNLLGVKYPDFYKSLAHGIFQEIYRFGVFYKWELFPESPSAMIVGKEIWFKIKGQFVKQEEELRNDKHIEEIIRLLQIGNSRFKINEGNPQEEIVLKNGIRIKVMIPPLSNQPSIIFRRFIVSKFSFYQQAEYGTIPLEDVPFYEAMSNLYLNTIIAGEVESGKSTMLKTIYGTRDKNKVAILIESSPETFLKRDFPDRLVHELYTDKNGDIHKIIRDVLRIDHDYIIVQEVRGIEAEGAISATERGTRGTLMTYHITDPRRTPEQLAQHIADEFPNRKIINEIRRIAQQLDIGITMHTFEGNQKKVTSIYELCYDFDTDKIWINYLVLYDETQKIWRYNPEISPMLKERIFKYNYSLATRFVQHLHKRSQEFPMLDNPKRFIHFKE